MSNLLNVFYKDCTYKTAKCKGCSNKLIYGNKILSVIRTQGSFISTSNYCINCAEAELKSDMDEMMLLVQKIITISEELNIDKIYNEAKDRFGTTLSELAKIDTLSPKQP
jgi:hypothetical protein